ncbi:MAG: hypothetical protein IT209_06825 [Armatimonadetes bacterium]|nr:hypothetical protein [Armatimonadota bacterium]
MRKSGVWIALLALGALTIVSDASITRDTARDRELTPGGSSVYASLAGQFRTVFANLLWMKADSYHHEFVEHNPNWAQDTDILPLMRMITSLDPHFTQAYASGGWMLGLYQKKPQEAKRFLNEGIRNNPKSAELYETLGFIIWRCDKDGKLALANYREAEKNAATEFDRERLARAVRTLQHQVASSGNRAP